MSESWYWHPTGKQLALLFSHEAMVHTSSFKARIAIKGRLLATIHPDDGTWLLDGVNPGAISVRGSGFEEVENQLRIEMNEILEDIALSCASIEEFKKHVGDFVRTTDNRTVRKWLVAARKEEKDCTELENTDAVYHAYSSSRWRNDAKVREVEDSLYIAAAAR